jgi:AraC-like DNA-binding protein
MAEFTINGTQNLEFVSPTEIKNFRPAYSLPNSNPTVIQCEQGYCYFQEWNGTHYDVWLSEYPTAADVTLYGAVERRLIEMQFMLGDGADHQMNGLGKLEIPACSVNMYHEPYVENRVFLKKNSRMVTFDIHLQPEGLQDLCLLLPALAPFCKQVEQGQFAAILSSPIPVPPYALSSIQAILHMPAQPQLQTRTLQPLVESLLINTLSYITESRPKPIKANARERKAIRELAYYLRTELDSEKTVEDFSKIYLINRQKIKALFKEMYGVPIRQFSIRERLEKACFLLRETDASVQEIAFTVGYHMPSSFVEKFKEAYFLSPLQYRKLTQKS